MGTIKGVKQRIGWGRARRQNALDELAAADEHFRIAEELAGELVSDPPPDSGPTDPPDTGEPTDPPDTDPDPGPTDPPAPGSAAPAPGDPRILFDVREKLKNATTFEQAMALFSDTHKKYGGAGPGLSPSLGAIFNGHTPSDVSEFTVTVPLDRRAFAIEWASYLGRIQGASEASDGAPQTGAIGAFTQFAGKRGRWLGAKNASGNASLVTHVWAAGGQERFEQDWPGGSQASIPNVVASGPTYAERVGRWVRYRVEVDPSSGFDGVDPTPDGAVRYYVDGAKVAEKTGYRVTPNPNRYLLMMRCSDGVPEQTEYIKDIVAWALDVATPGPTEPEPTPEPEPEPTEPTEPPVPGPSGVLPPVGDPRVIFDGRPGGAKNLDPVADRGFKGACDAVFGVGRYDTYSSVHGITKNVEDGRAALLMAFPQATQQNQPFESKFAVYFDGQPPEYWIAYKLHLGRTETGVASDGAQAVGEIGAFDYRNDTNDPGRTGKMLRLVGPRVIDGKEYLSTFFPMHNGVRCAWDTVDFVEGRANRSDILEPVPWWPDVHAGETVELLHVFRASSRVLPDGEDGPWYSKDGVREFYVNGQLVWRTEASMVPPIKRINVEMRMSTPEIAQTLYLWDIVAGVGDPTA